MRVASLFRTLLLGQSAQQARILYPALRHQRVVLARVWQNRNYRDYGLERLIRLFLASVPFVLPGLYLREAAGRWGLAIRNLAVDLYVVLKLATAMAVLLWQPYGWPLALSSVLMIETACYMLSLIFLSEDVHQSSSVRRSITSLFLNFGEITFTFAALYRFLALRQADSFSCSGGLSLAHPLTAAYFSLVNATTVGYGDVTPHSAKAQLLVMAQVSTSFIFIFLVISFFTSRFSDHHPNGNEGKAD